MEVRKRMSREDAIEEKPEQTLEGEEGEAVWTSHVGAFQAKEEPVQKP